VPLGCKARLIKIKDFGRILCSRLQSGDTLIEVIVAMLILGLMILGLAPLLAKIHLYERINASKAEAYNLAEGQVEAIRSAPYASKQNANGTWSGMGTYAIVSGGDVYGNPPGSFPQVATYADQNTPGIIYYMDTQIRYKPDPSRSSGDPTTVDYKDITVEVQAQIPGLPSALLPSVTLNTRVTQENQWGEMPGGNIYVEAEDVNSNPVGNMAVFLMGPWGPNLTTYAGWTDTASGDMPGYLFASLLPGTYTMVATDSTNPWDGWMVAPGTQGTVGAGNPPIIPLSTSAGQWCTITTNETTYMYFHAAQAGTLTLKFTGANIGTSAITLTGSSSGYSYSATGNGMNPVPLPGPIYPDTYKVQVSGHTTNPNPYYITVSSSSNPTQTIAMSS
jgi:prepilin-type N-terminal cleavage/methylation domain-containing protein